MRSTSCVGNWTPQKELNTNKTTNNRTNMQHIKRINDSTFHVTIGERILEITGKSLTPETVKKAVQMWLTADPAQPHRVTDITELLRIEAESTLITVSRQLGCAGTERYSDGALHLRHPFGLIRAGWSRKDHNWTLSTEQDVYVCDPDTVSVRKALTFLLDDMTNKEDGGGIAAAFLFGAIGIVLGAVIGHFFL